MSFSTLYVYRVTNIKAPYHIYQPFKKVVLGYFKHECTLSSPYRNPQQSVRCPFACSKCRLASACQCLSLTWPASPGAASSPLSPRSAGISKEKTQCPSSCSFHNLKALPPIKLGISGLKPTG